MFYSPVKLLPFSVLSLCTLGTALPLATIVSTVAHVSAATPQQSATQAVVRTVAQPNLPAPTVQKITLHGQYGLATWGRGDAGGLVALVNKDGTWQVITLGGGMPDATALSQRSGIPIAAAQALLGKHSTIAAVSTTPFSSILPRLKRQTQVPILLPSTLPIKQTMYYRIEEASTNRYSVTINYVDDCLGTPCNFGSVQAERGGEFTKPMGLPRETFKSISLQKKTPGLFVNACGAYCTAYVEWKFQGVLYRVSVKNGREAEVVAMANSAIVTGRRATSSDCEKRSAVLPNSFLTTISASDKCR